MAKNQGQVKSKGEEENKKPKPGLWERTKQILKPAALITAATIGFLLGGPIGVALVLGISAFISHKIDQRDARKNAYNQDNKGDKNKSDSHDKENKKEGKKPGAFKRILFAIGAILLGALLGGWVGAIFAIALIVSDLASGGKLTKWSENVVKAPFKLIKEGWSKGKEIQWTSKRGAGEETGQEKGKEQVAGRGVTEEKLRRSGQSGPSTQEPGAPGSGEVQEPKSLSGFDNPNYSTQAAVQAENPSASAVKAGEDLRQSSPGGRSTSNQPVIPKTQEQVAQAPLVQAEGAIQHSSPGGQGVDGSPTNMSTEVKRQVEQAVAPLAQTAKPLVEAENPSAGGVEAGGAKTKREVVGDATERLSKEDPVNQASVVRK